MCVRVCHALAQRDSNSSDAIAQVRNSVWRGWALRAKILLGPSSVLLRNEPGLRADRYTARRAR